MLRRVAVSSVLALALLASCGGDDDSSEAGDTTTTAVEPTTTTVAETTTTTVAPRDCAADGATATTIEPTQVVVGCRIESLGDPLDGAEIGLGTYGPLDGGMSYEEASAVANRPIILSPYAEEDDPLQLPCVAFSLGDGEDRIGGVGGSGDIRTLYVNEPGAVTSEGVGVGATRAEIQAAYPGAREVDNIYVEEQDLYVDGTLPDGEPATLRFVFDESDEVNLIITGAASHAGLPEGCA
ncbi:MAG: hypothetical protein M3Z03_02000 [Actinomycetota bacterium]|nr:hypothetical protein [Actinomycetota bacterium]